MLGSPISNLRFDALHMSVAKPIVTCLMSYLSGKACKVLNPERLRVGSSPAQAIKKPTGSESKFATCTTERTSGISPCHTSYSFDRRACKQAGFTFTLAHKDSSIHVASNTWYTNLESRQPHT